MIVRFLSIIFLFTCGSLQAQKLIGVGGNGQMVNTFFQSTTPLTVEARDANGRLVANLPISWSISPTLGTLSNPMAATDANGRASTLVIGSAPPQSTSFQQGTIVASSSFGSVTFYFTTVPSLLSNGNLALPPQVDLLTPVISNNRTVNGIAGQVQAGAIVVRVVGGGFIPGTPIPNVGVRLTTNDIRVLPASSCNTADGIVLTDANGIATCDVKFGTQVGTEQVVAQVGDFNKQGPILLVTAAGTACTYVLSETNRLFGPAGGNASVNIATQTNCPWTASSNAGWVTFVFGASGSGSGVLGYNVAANTGPARMATITLGGLPHTVQQNSSALTLVSSGALAGGTAGQAYSTTLVASGGVTPYSWFVAGSLPPGFTLSPLGGTIGGITGTAGVYSFTLTVTDAVGATASQPASIQISSSSSATFSITNTAFPVGTVGTAYQQGLLTSGGCSTPFSKSPVFALVSGALPDGLSVKQLSDSASAIAGTPTTAGIWTFTIRAIDVCGAVATQTYSISIQPQIVTPGAISVSPGTLTFTAQQGGTSPLPAQTLSIAGSGSGFAYAATGTTASGGNWLMFPLGSSGNVPASLQVAVTGYDQLAPGVYQGAITINSQASNGPVNVPVSLVVLAPATALVASPSSVNFSVSTLSAGSGTQQAVQITSTAGSVKFTVSTSGNPWLFPAIVAGETPAVLVINVRPAGLGAGLYTGTVTLTPIGGSTQPLTIAVRMNVATPAVLTVGPSFLTFAAQTGVTTSAQTVNVVSTGDSIPFTASSNASWLLINNGQQAASRTPGLLVITVNPAGLAGGTHNASITISQADATVAPVTMNVTLIVPAQPLPTLAAITNAASFARGPVSPGEIVTVFGTNFGPAVLSGLRLNGVGAVDTVISDTRILFDGIPAPMVYSSNGQLSAVVPYSVRNKNLTTVEIEYQGARSAPLTIPVSPAAPGILTLDSSGQGQGAILNQNFSINSVNNPAEPGSIISIFATGEGDTDPPGVDGKLATLPLPRPLLPVSVLIGGLPALVTYAGGAPGALAGLFQVNAKIPDGLRRGVPATVQIRVGDATSQSNVALAVQP